MSDSKMVIEVLERLLGHELHPGNRGPLSNITVHELHTYLAEGAPRAVERTLPNFEGTHWGLIDTAVQATEYTGRELLRKHGPAPRPDWLKKVKRTPFTRSSEAGNLDDIDLVEQAERLGLRTEVTRNQSTDDLKSSDSLRDIEHRLFG